MNFKIEINPNNDLIEQLLCIYDKTFSPNVKISHKKIRKRIDRGIYKIILFQNQNQNEIVGFGFISLNPTLKSIFIDYLCIDKKYQKEGWGKKFLSFINQPTLFPEYKYCLLECEHYLVSYYQKNNFYSIPLNYPLENQTPLYLLYSIRDFKKVNKTKKYLLYHSFVGFGLLFNGEIIIHDQIEKEMNSNIRNHQKYEIVNQIFNFQSTFT